MSLTKTNNMFKSSAKIGSICIFTYLVSYLSRNITSVVTPTLVEEKIYTKSELGLFSTVYFAVYAIGQLLNGVLGDRIRSKYMILIGCLIAGSGMLLFPVWNNPILNIASFAMLGFGLSMLRGPLMKIIAENMSSTAAETVCVLFSVASFAGPLLASLLAIVFKWQWVFYVTAIFALVMGIGSFFYFSVLERKGIITFKSKKENIFKGLKNLFFIPNFVFFLLVAAIVEIATSSITFWIPTYMTEYLELSQKMSAGVFSVISLLNLVAPFVCIFIYHRFFKDYIKLEALMFALSAFFFLLLIFTKGIPILNILLFALAKITTGCASTVLWSIYIPSLAKYGSVSTGNGVFDFSGYAAAAMLNAFFASFSNWNGVIISWVLIMLVGVIGSVISIFINKRIKEA
ncbi:MAG: MFS transporter [Clostridia bacterium]|nr:MFS transporter [Clostridia bacterium]